MRLPEFLIAMVLAGFGVRGLLHWVRRPLASTSARDHLLYALYVTGRVGLWFAFAGVFLLFAFAGTTDPVTGERVLTRGTAFVDAVERYRGLLLVPIVLATMQFVGGWFLGRSAPGEDRGP